MRQRTIPATPERVVQEDVSRLEIVIGSRELHVVVGVSEEVDEDGELKFELNHSEAYLFKGEDFKALIQSNPQAFRGVRDAILDAVDARRNE